MPFDQTVEHTNKQTNVCVCREKRESLRKEGNVAKPR